MMWLVIEGQQMENEASNCDFKFIKQRKLSLSVKYICVYENIQ